MVIQKYVTKLQEILLPAKRGKHVSILYPLMHLVVRFLNQTKVISLTLVFTIIHFQL